MKFNVFKGPYVKTTNTIYKMMNKYIYALLPIIIYTYINYINQFMYILLCIILEIIIKILYSFLKHKKIFKEYIYICFIDGILIGLLIKTSIILTIFILLISFFITEILKLGFGENYFNRPLLTKIILLNLFCTNQIYNMDIIYSAISLGSLLYLIFFKNIKYRVVISYLLIIYLRYNNIYFFDNNLIFIAVFILPNKSPTTKNGEYLYGIILGILSIVFKNNITEIILLSNLLIDKIDMMNIYSKKK